MTSTSSDDSSPPYATGDAASLVGDRVVVPVVEGESSRTRAIALDVASETRSELLFARLETPEDGTESEPLTTGASTDVGRGPPRPGGAPVGTVTGTGHTPADALEDAVRDRSVGTIVLENGRRMDLADLLLGETPARLANRTQSNVFVVTEADRRGPVSSILVPVGGGPYSELALSLAEVLARANGAWVDVYHVVDPDASPEARRRAEEYVQSCADRLGDFERVDAWVQEAPDVSEAIIEQTGYYDLTVLGSPTKGRLRRFLFGSTTDDVQTDARNTVVTVRGP